MRILANGSKERGDLFARLVADLFSAQGYDEPDVNVGKSGREVDLRAYHRLEPKMMVAECKATESPIGGAALNKFAGVLQMEAQDEDAQVQGYFVSLNGFTETALEQERGADPPRFVLLTGEDVQEQLVTGKMVVSRARAIEAATRLLDPSADLALLGDPGLLAHRLGWIWLCAFGRHHERSHFALIHADGQPIGAELAKQLIAADSDGGGELDQLSYLAPAPPESSAAAEADQVYRDYLLAELGQFTLEGLPADEEVGARRIALEDLYIPLSVDKPEAPSPDATAMGMAEDEVGPREPIGKALESAGRLAVLAAPGAGKSTLLKRLAVAYAARTHRELIDDELPDEDWFPIFIRCRALGGGDVSKTVHELISEIPVRGEFPRLRQAYVELASEALLAGRALLLIDGLDEITEQADRLRFVLQLRTFLATYPNARIVLTSRPAGFRIVAGAMSSLCVQRRLSEFSNEDIGSLTRAWHATVVGDSSEVEVEARELAVTIIANDRVRRLARNPLLLTTLLLVKRWVGDLPRKRTILYEKAIEVLLMTWNVEAHDPIDRDEAIPQLAYVAHSLTCEGEQSVSSLQLTTLLNQARDQMPDVLGFAQATTSQFIEQIETRSSLLVMTGHVVDNGQLVPNYEFRHLTFQEYLAAVALVEGYYHEHDEGDRLPDRLAPYWGDPRWSEVIALALVIAGRSAGPVVEAMMDSAKRDDEIRIRVLDLLAGALADEVQLPPARVRELALLLGRSRALQRTMSLPEILAGRYGEAVVSTIEQRYFDDSGPDFADYASGFEAITEARAGAADLTSERDRRDLVLLLESDDDEEVARAALLAMEAAYSLQTRRGFHRVEGAADIPRLLICRCEDGRPFVAYMAAWALVWFGEAGLIAVNDRVRALQALLELWRNADPPALRREAAWAFSAVPTNSRGGKLLGDANPELIAFVEEEFASDPRGMREDRRPAALLLAYYLEEPWSHEELKDRVGALWSRPGADLKTIGRLFPRSATARRRSFP
ncbi:MAG TPA: NACHT domain-containing protein [Solirubrobacterales bacterium]|nr:NACHT domain-containing protein [Solirubrobacterales bacterium]